MLEPSQEPKYEATTGFFYCFIKQMSANLLCCTPSLPGFPFKVGSVGLFVCLFVCISFIFASLSLLFFGIHFWARLLRFYHVNSNNCFGSC